MTLDKAGIAAAALALLVCTGLVPAHAAKYTMVISHLAPEDLGNNEMHPAMKHFESILEAATGGDIDVQVFGNGQLGSEVETARQAQAGRLVQASLISSGAMSSFFPDYQIVTTPFLFPDYRIARAYFDGEWHANFMRGTLKSGLRYLGTLDDGGGFVAFTNNKRLIKTVADIKGLKIRVEENPAHVATMKALGASATPLPWGEVITALNTGLADGQFNAPGVSLAFKLWEVNDYTTWSGHVYNSVSWVVSDKWFGKLPKNYQEAVLESAREAVQVSHGIAVLAAIKGWEASCKNFKKCHILTQAEKQAMAEVARPAWRKWVTGDFGIKEKLVDDLWQEVARLERETDQRDHRRYGR
ncbi:MAG: ABC transporter substrate-binding protein [Betaproteobacteria bacterium SG8_40]|jgi:tripartite ATP-independent transporter DctP family solute receptor|nr:MAG: ABC transporter substrate-binding protein [Betaproteobacteria bacterium SG8_40]